MVDRVLVLLLAVVAVVAVALIARVALRARTRRVLAAGPDFVWSSLEASPDGRRTIVAFSSPSCAACHTAQFPALQRVEQQVGEAAVRLISVDVARRSSAASAFGVLTVPSTAVLDAHGRVLAVNHGFTPSSTLLQQLQLG